MDEHAVLLRGNSVRFRGNFVDENLKDITWWTEKHNRFTTRQMVDFINLEQGVRSYVELLKSNDGHYRTPVAT